MRGWDYECMDKCVYGCMGGCGVLGVWMCGGARVCVCEWVVVGSMDLGVCVYSG